MEDNLNARGMTIDDFVKAASNSHYNGMDLSLLIISKMLKVVIAIILPDYIWISCLDVNVREASVVIVYYGHKCFYGTGN